MDGCEAPLLLAENADGERLSRYNYSSIGATGRRRRPDTMFIPTPTYYASRRHRCRRPTEGGGAVGLGTSRLRGSGVGLQRVPLNFRQAMGGQRRMRLPVLGRFHTENLLLLFTLLAVVGGSAAGLLLNSSLNLTGVRLSSRRLMYIKFPGEMFIRMLKMLIVPLVIASNISAIASLNAKAARLLTALSLIYYVGTTLLAVSTALFLVCLIRPGVNVDPAAFRSTNNSSSSAALRRRTVADSIMDLIRNMIPTNLLVASFNKTATVARPVVVVNNESGEEDVLDEIIQTDVGVAGTNILGLITFSILFGFAVHSLGPDALVLADMFHAVRRVIIYLVSIVIWFSPIGIMCLITGELANTADLKKSLINLSWYVATVLSALLVHGAMVLPLLLFVFTRRNPLKYAYNMLQALMCALGTASSTATLPCTIRCLESGNQIEPRVTRFMLPLGTTINMDGTAIFQAVAAVFMAQHTEQPLNLGDLILIGMTSALASMAAASMPSAGMITIVMVLTAVGIDPGDIAILAPVDWFLDRIRTMVNVFSDSVGAAIVSELCEGRLLAQDEDEQEQQLPPAAFVEPHEYCGGLRDVELADYEAALGRRPTQQSPIMPFGAAAVQQELKFQQQQQGNGSVFPLSMLAAGCSADSAAKRGKKKKKANKRPSGSRDDDEFGQRQQAAAVYYNFRLERSPNNDCSCPPATAVYIDETAADVDYVRI